MFDRMCPSFDAFFEEKGLEAEQRKHRHSYTNNSLELQEGALTNAKSPSSFLPVQKSTMLQRERSAMVRSSKRSMAGVDTD